MNVQTIGPSSFAVIVSRGELIDGGLSPDSADAAAFSGFLLPRLGVETQDRRDGAYIEMYRGRDEMLFFLRLYREKPRFFLFPDFDTLTDAALACGGIFPSWVFYIGGQYVLVLQPPEDSPAPDILSEFGRELKAPPVFRAHLEEHGRLLLSCDALFSINKLFT